jgi:hypothetical protein
VHAALWHGVAVARLTTGDTRARARQVETERPPALGLLERYPGGSVSVRTFPSTLQEKVFANGAIERVRGVVAGTDGDLTAGAVRRHVHRCDGAPRAARSVRPYQAACGCAVRALPSAAAAASDGPSFAGCTAVLGMGNAEGCYDLVTTMFIHNQAGSAHAKESPKARARGHAASRWLGQLVTERARARRWSS